MDLRLRCYRRDDAPSEPFLESVDLDLRQLSYFVRVIELRSFTKAAKVLGISQPAIGEQIKNLEAELNAALLTRHSRGVEPTEAGRLLFNKARAILLQVEEARAEVHEYAVGLSGEVAIGLTPGLSDTIAAEAVERCSRNYPGVSINVIEDLSSSLIRRIAEKQALSFAIVSAYDLASTSNVNSLKLYVEDLYAVGHSRIVGKTDQPIPFRELAQFRLILLGSGSAQHGLKARLSQLAHSKAVQLSFAYEIQAISVVKQLAEREVGVAILSLESIRNRILDGRLCARRIDNPSVTRELNLIWNSNRALSRAEETVKNVLIQIITMDRDLQTTTAQT